MACRRGSFDPLKRVMAREIAKAYEPQQIEPRWAEFWVKEALFKADASAPEPVFSIVIPPPNVTGSLHIGHMLDHTEIDILCRWHRMRGYNTLYLPGTDHAGIATQRVVVKQLAEKGIPYRNLGREEFIKRVWQWKEESGGTIQRQMKQIGESCDWTRERFTMSPELSGVVREVFVRLYEQGLIYRANRLLNWCPVCLTVLSDLEVIHEERQGQLWYIKYPVVGSHEFLVVATTRPETMLGDTAVAVHPKDDRYKHLIGRKAMLPLISRELPIIGDGSGLPEWCFHRKDNVTPSWDAARHVLCVRLFTDEFGGVPIDSPIPNVRARDVRNACLGNRRSSAAIID